MLAKHPVLFVFLSVFFSQSFCLSLSLSPAHLNSSLSVGLKGIKGADGRLHLGPSSEGRAVAHGWADRAVGEASQGTKGEGKRRIRRDGISAWSALPPHLESWPPVVKPWGLCVLFK